MLRKLLGAGVMLAVVLAGCREPLGSCEQDSDCGAGETCEPESRLCFLAVTRFTAFEFLAPGGTDGAVKPGPVKLRARLVPSEGEATPRFPESVGFKVSEAGAVLAEGVLAHQGEGLYEGEWTAPPGEKTYELTLSYAESELSETKAFRTDGTAPRFSVSVPQAEVPAATGATTYADPQLPGAWRRDAVVSVSVTADEALEPGSVKLRVRGIGAGAAVEEVPVTPAESCTGAYCGVAQVDLSRPEMRAFRGNFVLEVRGADVAGNEGVVPDAGVVPVTRWKWVFETGAPIYASPALGSDGSVYFGSSADAASGKFFALKPDGTLKWPALSALGAVKASPTVGAQVNGVERVYVAANSAAGATLYALNSLDGIYGSEACTVNEAVIESSPALVTTIANNQSIESAVAVANLNLSSSGGEGTLTTLRPGGTTRCIPELQAGNISFPGAVSAIGNTVYFGADIEKTVKAYSFANAEWSPKSGWSSPTNLVARALALTSTSLVGAAREGAALFALNLENGSLVKTANANEGWNPSIGPGERALVGLAGGAFLRAIAADLTEVEPLGSSGGATKSAPLFGQGDFIYTTNVAGELKVRAGDFSPLWAEPGLGPVEGSPAIDCARPDSGGTALPGRPGVLYIPSTTSKLFAFVVDSRGLDTTAPWPKYQHDPRNTGNADTKLSDFACP